MINNKIFCHFKWLLFLLLSLITACQTNKVPGCLRPYEDSDSLMVFASELALENNTYKGSFSDDYNTFYFFRKSGSDAHKYIPYQSDFRDGKWTAPVVSSYYNGKNSYTYQLNIPGKNNLIFISNMRTERDTSKNPNYNFWSVVKSENGWDTPREVENQELIYNYNSQPCITSDGTIYFTSNTPDWSKTFSYKMERINGEYHKPELFEPVNKLRENNDWKIYEFCMAPDKNYMIITIQEKKDDKNLNTDLYISYFKNNEWTEPQKLGNTFNSSFTENFPYITPDGRYLIFTRAFSQFYIISTKYLLD